MCVLLLLKCVYNSICYLDTQVASGQTLLNTCTVPVYVAGVITAFNKVFSAVSLCLVYHNEVKFGLHSVPFI